MERDRNHITHELQEMGVDVESILKADPTDEQLVRMRDALLRITSHE